MLTITTNSFENDVLRADKPVLVISGPSGAPTAAVLPRPSTRWASSTPIP